MKKILFFIFVSLLFTPLASAHILKTDGNIGVLLHLNPEDDPIVGEPASFFFEIKDKENKFSAANCDCKVRIQKAGAEIFSGDVFAGSMNNDINSTVFSYTFAEKGIYNVYVNGTPKNADGFQPFAVQYDLRISRESGTNNTTPGNIWLFVGFGIVAVIVFAVIYFKKK